MLRMEEIRKRLIAYANCTAVAKAVDVKPSTIIAIRDGGDCKSSLHEKISDFFEKVERG